MTCRQPPVNWNGANSSPKGKDAVEFLDFQEGLSLTRETFLLLGNKFMNLVESNGGFTSFIPYRLNMPEFPEYYNFPFNILFTKRKAVNGVQLTGTALYEPEFHTFNKENDVSFMRYRNVYGGDCHIIVGYDEGNRCYYGEKFVNGGSVFQADGGDDWQQFFLNFTMLGLVNGERCEFS